MGGGWCGEGEGRSAAVQSNRAVVELVKKCESNSCGQFDRRLARPFSRPTKTTEKKTPASRPPAWGACARSVRRVPTSVVPPTRAGATPWALASPSLTPSPSASPRRGDLARCSSPQVALEPFRTPASAPFGSPSARGYAARGRAGSSVVAPLRLPDGQAGTSIPAPEGACQEVSPKFVQSDSPSGAVRS